MNRSLQQLQDRFDRVGRNVAMVRDAFISFEMGRLIGQSLDYAASLGEVSKQIGVSVKDLQVYRYAATQAGLSQEEMEAGLRKLTVSLGQAALGATGPQKAFDALGISVRGADGHVKTASGALPEIADRLAKVADPAQRAAVEIALLGRAGQKLDPLLSEGSKGIEELARQAENAGMIISDDLAASADQAADTVAKLVTQLKVNFSREVAQNAGAITGLANSLSTLTFQSLNFINTYPRLSAALAGAAIGARMGGPWGGLVGGAAGFVVGDKMADANATGNADLKFRTGELTKATTRMRQLMAMGGRGIGNRNSGPYKAAQAELARQRGLMEGARRSAMTPVMPPILTGDDLPNFLASPGGGRSGGRGRAGPDLAKQAQQREEAFQRQLERLDDELLGAKRDNLVNVSDLANNARLQLLAEDSATRAAIARDVKSGDLTQAQSDQLTTKLDQIKAERRLTINTEEMERLARANLDVSMAANDNEISLLQLQETLAVTAKDRRDIQLRILEIERDKERATQEDILASREATEAQKEIARLRLAQLGQEYGLKAQAVRQQTGGPLDEYLRASDPATIKERSQALVVGELQAVHAGITDALAGALGTKDPLITGLINLLVEQLLIRPITQALQNAQAAGGGGGGGFFGALLSIGGAVAGSIGSGGAAAGKIGNGKFGIKNAFAGGTNFAPPGLALVGEDGPEVVRFRGGEQVIPNHQIRGAARNDNGPQITINVQGAMSERQARETGAQIGREARRQLNGPVR